MAKTKSKTKSKTKKTKRISTPKQYPTYSELEGKAGKVKIDGEIVEGVVVELGEYDDNGTPHTAVFQHRREVTRSVVNPKDIERLEGNGFEGGY